MEARDEDGALGPPKTLRFALHNLSYRHRKRMDSASDIIVLNIGGKVFCTSTESLNRLPETKLGRMSRSGMLSGPNEIFFDRNPKVMHGILDLYRTGELHLPSNLCSNLIRKELEFWEVAEDLVSECCWKTYQASKTSKRIIDHIDHSLSDPYRLAQQDCSHKPLATRIWVSLDRPQHSYRARMWNLTYVLFMMLSVVIFALETVDTFRGSSHPNSNASNLNPEERELFSKPLNVLHYLDITCNIFFTLEPLVRLATCPNKLIFLTAPLNIIDLVLIVSMWVGLALEDIIVPSIRQASQGHVYLILTIRAVLALRVLRVLHLTKRFESMKVMMLSMKASSQELGLLMAVLFMAVLIYGNLVYIAEFIAETHVFQNVPVAVWWALVTLTTVGYGDFYPTSVSGYFIGSACAITGLLLLAMPIAIIATNFSTYYENLASYEQRVKRTQFIKKVLGRDNLFVKPVTTADSSHVLLHDCLDFSCCAAATNTDDSDDPAPVSSNKSSDFHLCPNHSTATHATSTASDHSVDFAPGFKDKSYHGRHLGLDHSTITPTITAVDKIDHYSNTGPDHKKAFISTDRLHHSTTALPTITCDRQDQYPDAKPVFSKSSSCTDCLHHSNAALPTIICDSEDQYSDTKPVFGKYSACTDRLHHSTTALPTVTCGNEDRYSDTKPVFSEASSCSDCLCHSTTTHTVATGDREDNCCSPTSHENCSACTDCLNLSTTHG